MLPKPRGLPGRLLNDTGVIALVALNAPTVGDRELARQIVGDEHFHEVHVATELEECEANDDSGIYQRARAGEIENLPGINGPYDPPAESVFSLVPTSQPTEELVGALLSQLNQWGVTG